MTPTSLRGRLLVAAPSLRDPNFARSVVYLLEHGPEGALGVIINRPSQIEVDEVLEEWALRAAPPAVVFRGGPVAEAGAIALQPGGDAVEIVDLHVPPDRTDAEVIRLFLGHSGWGPEQLDDEIDAGGWIPLAADAGDVFSAEPEELWERVLRRAGGHYAWLANAPPDLSMN